MAKTARQSADDNEARTVRAQILKADGGVIISNAREIEDDYVEFYRLEGARGLIEPPYNLKQLEKLVQTNNTLGPCIEAMVNNIDGTGYEIERRDGEKMSDTDNAKVQPAKDFFDECSPMMSFDTLRKQTRRDLESTGMGYMEVMRNAANEIVFIGRLDSKAMRLARLDSAVPVMTKIIRNGKETTITRLKRERRYAQKVGERLVWFAEYGASRKLHKESGLWEDQMQGTIPPNMVASEVLMFGIDPDHSSPYFTPRWISQTPSVIGSRQAEEHNLEFFSSGGIPPYLVIVQGGQLAEKTVEAVRDALNQKGAHARVQVIEAFSTSGSLESNSSVQVKVERFGAERQNDAMFAQFDKDCEARVRKAFRLPPIFVGKSEDYNFASAHASYLVAEAQVFSPERQEFDEIISSSVLVELLGTRDYVFRSKPISIIDAATKLQVIEAAITMNRVDPEHTLTLLGEMAGIEFKMLEGDQTTTPVPQLMVAEHNAANAAKAPAVPGAKPQNKAPKPPAANVVPIRQNKTASEDDEMHELATLLGCTLAVMAENPM